MSKPDIDCPVIAEGLVDFLRLAFPDRLPPTIADANPTEIARRIGQQEVIRHLEALHELQREQH